MVFNLSPYYIPQEHTSDKVIKSLPTLEDIGVSPIHIEEQMPWEVSPWQAYAYYIHEIGEFAEPKPPKTIPIRYANN